MARLVTAIHTIVSEGCFQAHDSPEAAIDEALRQVKKEAMDIANGWGRPFRPQLHFKLIVEKPGA